MRQVGGFIRVLRFPPPIKLTVTPIYIFVTKILLKVALNIITLTQMAFSSSYYLCFLMRLILSFVLH
jgi:hypothetical protein